MITFLRHLHYLLPLTLGLSDGMFTALTFGASLLVGRSPTLDLSLAVRVAAAGATSGFLVYFVAAYAEQRRGLVRAARQLNIGTVGHFGTTRLLRTVTWEAAAQSLITAAAGFVGGLLPLMVGAMLSDRRWMAAVAAVAGLAGLGVGLSHVVEGSPLRWALGLGGAGAVVWMVGTQLRVL